LQKSENMVFSCVYGSTVLHLKVVIDLLYAVLMHSHLKSSRSALLTLLAASQQIEGSSKKSNKNYQDGFRTDSGRKTGSAKCD